MEIDFVDEMGVDEMGVDEMGILPFYWHITNCKLISKSTFLV
jgi:hypothetical protein